MTKNFNWTEDYFFARTILGFSENEFWESTPRKIHTLIWALHAHQGRANQKIDPRVTAKELISLLRL